MLELASEELRQTLEMERARFGDLQDFVGKDFNQWARMLGLLVPDAPFIHASNARWRKGQFMVDSNGVEGMTYSLWQSFDLLPSNWQPVTGAEVQIDGATVTLIDPGPPSNQPIIRYVWFRHWGAISNQRGPSTRESPGPRPW